MYTVIIKNGTVGVYVAEDGRVFYDKDACIEYERNVINPRYFRLVYSPCLRDGRGYYKRRFVKCEFGMRSEMIVEEYCRVKFGRVYDFIMGRIDPNAIMRKYYVDEITLEAALKEISSLENSKCKLENCIVLKMNDKGNVVAEEQDTFI